MNTPIVFLAFFLISLTAIFSQESGFPTGMRKWTSKNGKEIQATVTHYNHTDGKIKMELDTGKIFINVDIKTLSIADQSFLNQLVIDNADDIESPVLGVGDTEIIGKISGLELVPAVHETSKRLWKSVHGGHLEITGEPGAAEKVTVLFKESHSKFMAATVLGNTLKMGRLEAWTVFARKHKDVLDQNSAVSFTLNGKKIEIKPTGGSLLLLTIDSAA